MNKVKRIYISTFLSGAFIFNMPVITYSFEQKTNIVDTAQASNLKDIVYLTEGQGAIYQGNGEIGTPYRSLETALKNVRPGGVIRIIGQFKYWRYEETSNYLSRPLVIDKEVTIEGAGYYNEFIVRAPIQLGANVTFRNLNMQFWASNELMPGVPDSGIPQTPVDQGTDFKSCRSIYLAGYELTLDNIDTRIFVSSHQKDYRPYINAGTFIEGGQTGNKAVLNVKNPNGGTELAGIYAGDYWTTRNYPVELNIKGRVLDGTVHTGGIMAPSDSEVVVNISNKTGISAVDTHNTNGSVDVNIKGGEVITDGNLNGIRNLTIESGSMIQLKEESKFEVENLTLKDDSLLDLRNIDGDAIVNGNFIGETDGGAGSIYLDNGKILDVKGDVEGTTLLNKFRYQAILFEQDTLYVRAQLNASGEFLIEPKYEQSNYELIKNENDGLYTTWTTVRNSEVFKDMVWGRGDDEILNPSEGEYFFYYELINDKDEVYIPWGEEWDDIQVTLERENGTSLDLNYDFDGDIFLGTYLDDDDKSYVSIEFTPQYIEQNPSEVLTLKVSHKDGKEITKQIYVGMEKPETEPDTDEETKPEEPDQEPDVDILDIAIAASKYNLEKGEEGYEEKYDLNNDGIIDIFDLVILLKNRE